MPTVDPVLNLPWWVDYVTARMAVDPPASSDPLFPIAESLLAVLTEAHTLLALVDALGVFPDTSEGRELEARLRKVLGK